MRNTVLLITVSLLLLSACAPAPAEPTAAFALADTATSAPIETATARPTKDPNATPVELREFGKTGECCRGQVFVDGTYRLPAFLGVNLSFEKTGYWRFVNIENYGMLGLMRGANEFGDGTEWMSFVAWHADKSEEQFQADILASAELQNVSGPSDVTIAGYSGWQIDAQVKLFPGEGSATHAIVAGAGDVGVMHDFFGNAWITDSPEAMMRFVVLHVGGTKLAIIFEGRPEEWETLLTDAQLILDSLAPIDQ